jgi:hypothetical protein
LANDRQEKKKLINEAKSNINKPMYRSQPEKAPLQEGDRVRLKQPFRPNWRSPEEWHFGVVVGLIQASPKADPSEVTGIVLYLYNLQTCVRYQDESGEKILFYFKQDEVEPYSSR